MGRLKEASERLGIPLPGDGHRTERGSRTSLLDMTRVGDPSERRVAVRNLCTCHVQADDDRIWERLLEMAHDPDAGVRRDVLHAITDSTPGTRVAAVVETLESMRNDADLRLRRRVRKTLAHYRRTGKITDAAG